MLCWVNNNKNVLIQRFELSSSNVLDFYNSVIDIDNQNMSVLNIATVIWNDPGIGINIVNNSYLACLFNRSHAWLTKQ